MRKAAGVAGGMWPAGEPELRRRSRGSPRPNKQPGREGRQEESSRESKAMTVRGGETHRDVALQLQARPRERPHLGVSVPIRRAQRPLPARWCAGSHARGGRQRFNKTGSTHFSSAARQAGALRI